MTEIDNSNRSRIEEIKSQKKKIKNTKKRLELKRKETLNSLNTLRNALRTFSDYKNVQDQSNISRSYLKKLKDSAEKRLEVLGIGR